jgi:hypothetical protein
MHLGILLAVATSPAAAHSSIDSYLSPILTTFVVIAVALCTVYLGIGGFHYMTASGDVQKLARAKRLMRNTVIGLVLIIAAAALTSTLSAAFTSPGAPTSSSIPSVVPVNPINNSNIVEKVLLGGIESFLKAIVTSIADPIMNGLDGFIKSTPYMSKNSTVYELYGVTLAIADALFVAVVALLGFHLMSADVFGYEEMSIKFLLPRLGLIFVLMNASIFAIDAVIGLSNAIVSAIYAGISATDLWTTLSSLTDKLAGNQGLVTLLLMIVMVVFAVILYIYYVCRLLTLFLGAVLAPLVTLLCLIPSFREFAIGLIKNYIAVIFVLPVHVLILALTSSLLVNIAADPTTSTNAATFVLLAIAAMWLLLKTPGVMHRAGYSATGLAMVSKMGATVATNTFLLSKIAGQAAYVGGTKKLDDETSKVRKQAQEMAIKHTGWPANQQHAQSSTPSKEATKTASPSAAKPKKSTPPLEDTRPESLKNDDSTKHSTRNRSDKS